MKELLEVLTILPDVGESYVIGACKSRGINVQRRRIRKAIMAVAVDPVIVELFEELLQM